MAIVTKQILWVSYTLRDLKVPFALPIVLKSDNKSAQLIAANLCLHGRTKHIDIDIHLAHDEIADGLSTIGLVSSQLQLAYFLTKPLGAHQLAFLSSKISLQPAPS